MTSGCASAESFRPANGQTGGRIGRRLRVGIDVGGTFTDVVVIEEQSREVLKQLKVPTTHRAAEGVALGIIHAVEQVFADLKIEVGDVTFIAHSTTQATNALLEGDLAAVGIIGMGRGWESWKARYDTRVPPIQLAPGRWFRPEHRFHDTAGSFDVARIRELIASLRKSGAKVIVASEAFGVDLNENETRVADLVRDTGILVTCGHEVSTLYGLRTRTRTAVLNAAILPKMLGTAQMTAACVERIGIAAPLMVMRSDGGVMGLEDVRRRPIMTLLSGPAAGIAGALMYEGVSDGVFIEVGGTSSDISVIRDGQAQMRPARIGNHRTFLRTLDVRTLAVAGGSLIRERNGRLLDVGPRSAYIAGLAYASFAPASQLEGARLVHLQLGEKDAEDYLAVETPAGVRYALTPTCAANLLGYVRPGDFAFGDLQNVRLAFLPLARALGTGVEEAAEQVLKLGCAKIQSQIESLIAEYHLSRVNVELVGGGGGAAAVVPYTAGLLGLKHRIARNAEVISTIGVAMAMVRDVVERNVVEPSPEKILEIRREAADSAIRSGALPETVEVHVEVDTRRNLVRATAFGATEPQRRNGAAFVEGEEACRRAAARSMQLAPARLELLAKTDGAYVFGAEIDSPVCWGLFKTKRRMVRVVDSRGGVRLQREHAVVMRAKVAEIERTIDQAVTRMTDFGDAGRTLPDMQLLVRSRLINLGGLVDAQQAMRLAKVEMESLPPDEVVIVVVAPKNS